MKKILLLSSLAFASFSVMAQEQSNAPVFTYEEEVVDGVTNYKFTLSGDWATYNSNLEQKIDEVMDILDGDHDCANQTTPDFTPNTGCNVTITSPEDNNVIVCYQFTQGLVTGRKVYKGTAGQYEYHAVNINELDLSGVSVTKFNGHASLSNDGILPDATFKCINGSTQNYITKLVMPRFAESVPVADRVIPQYILAQMNYVKVLVLPENTDKVGRNAFYAANSIQDIKLNQGLRFIANSAFSADNSDNIANMEPKALDIPSSVKYIGPGAFNFRLFSDIYYHTAKSPICPIGKTTSDPSKELPMLYFMSYTGNGGISNARPGSDNYSLGIANRENYVNGTYWLTMLHYPMVDSLDLDTYQDATRVYHKIYGNQYNTAQQGEVVVAYPGIYREYEKTVGDVVYYKDENGKTSVWGGSYGIETVGNETSTLRAECGGQDASTTVVGTVLSGFEDTTRGLSYIWPSQTQYTRAYATAYNGVKWDGVTPYRPELTEEEYLLMVEDELEFKDASGNWVSIADMYYTEASAAAYNETLDDAIHAGDVKDKYTQDEVDEYNASLMVHEGDPIYYTEEEVFEHNATLVADGAVHEGDVKETKVLTWDEWVALSETMDNPYWLSNGDVNETTYADDNNVNNWHSWFGAPAKVVEIKYTKEEAALLNAGLEGAISVTDVKHTLTAGEAAEINANNPNFLAAGAPKSYYTEAEAIEHNAKLDGAKKVYDPVVGAPDYTDILRKNAYMSNRRIVFADTDGGGGENHEIKIRGEHWWTICLPYDLTKDQVTKYFGEGTHVCYFSRVDRNIHEKEGSGVIKFYFTDDQYARAEKGSDVVLRAHHPYMIYPMKDCNDAVNMAYAIPYKEVWIQSGQPVPSYCLANMGYKVKGFVEQQNAEDESNNWLNNKSACYYSHDVLENGKVPTIEADNEDDHDHTEYIYIGNYGEKVPVLEEDVPSLASETTFTNAKIPLYSYFYALKNNTSRYQYWFAQNPNINWAANKCVIQATGMDGRIKENNTFFKKDTREVKQVTILGDEAFEEDATPVEKVVIIAGDGEDSEVVYNLNGVQIMDKPQNGIFIKGGKKYLAR